MVGDNEELWERKFKQDFNVEGDVSLRPGIIFSFQFYLFQQ